MFVNPIFSQMPKSLIGSHEVISKANVDVLVIQKDRVTGKVSGQNVGEYIFQKKENDYYYFKKVRKNKIEASNKNKDVENTRRKSDGKIALSSPNQKVASSDQPDIKVQIIKLENDKTKLIIDYLNNKGKVIKKETMVIQ